MRSLVGVFRNRTSEVGCEVEFGQQWATNVSVPRLSNMALQPCAAGGAPVHVEVHTGHLQMASRCRPEQAARTHVLIDMASRAAGGRSAGRDLLPDSARPSRFVSERRVGARAHVSGSCRLGERGQRFCTKRPHLYTHSRLSNADGHDLGAAEEQEMPHPYRHGKQSDRMRVTG